MIDFDTWRKLDLRIGQVLSAEPHPNADRLIVMQVDLGSEKRQLVAGLKEHYEPESLVGRKIVVLANLEPAKLRGVESQGMLLAATDTSESGEQVVSILMSDRDVSPGSKIS